MNVRTFVAALSMMFWVGCTETAPKKEIVIEGQKEVVEEGTMAHIGDDLKIGAGNFRVEGHFSPGGQSVKGLTGGLWIQTRAGDAQGKNWTEQKVRAFPGMEIDLERYRIKVVDVAEKKKGVVVLDVISKQSAAEGATPVK